MSLVGRGLLLSLVFAFLGAAPPAVAHTDLAEASPPPGAVLSAPPAELVLVFTDAVTPAVDAVAVSGPDGTRLDRGRPAVDPANVLTTPLAAGGPGTVTVQYRVLAADGHVIEGSYQFEVTEAPPTSASLAAPTSTASEQVAAPAANPPSDDDDDTVGLALLALAVLVGLVGGTAAWVVGRRGS